MDPRECNQPTEVHFVHTIHGKGGCDAVALICDHLECEVRDHINNNFSKAFNTLREMKKNQIIWLCAYDCGYCMGTSIIWALLLCVKYSMSKMFMVHAYLTYFDN